MILLTKAQKTQLLKNTKRDRDGSIKPVVKFFNPCGAATWLFSELDEDGDTLYGLCDLGMGDPELGYASLKELQNIQLRFGLKIERDRWFKASNSSIISKNRYLGILRSVSPNKPWRGQVEILSVVDIDPVKPHLKKNSIRDQGGANIKPYDGEIPDYDESMEVVKQKLIDTMRKSYYDKGHVKRILFPMFRLHFPKSEIPQDIVDEINK